LADKYLNKINSELEIYSYKNIFLITICQITVDMELCNEMKQTLLTVAQTTSALINLFLAVTTSCISCSFFILHVCCIIVSMVVWAWWD